MQGSETNCVFIDPLKHMTECQEAKEGREGEMMIMVMHRKDMKDFDPLVRTVRTKRGEGRKVERERGSERIALERTETTKRD